MKMCRTLFIDVLLWYAFVKPAVFDNETNFNDDELTKTLIKCNKIVRTPLLTICSFRIRLLNSYNILRSKIASGRYPGQPTIGNMLRVKWLASVETYTQELVNHCYSSRPDELNIEIKGDPYITNYTYSCDLIYMSHLFEEWYLDEIINFMIEASFYYNFFGDFDETGSYKRISVEGFACSINLNNVALLTTEAYMSCGFCTSLPVTKPALNAKPCSQCDPVPPDVEAIPNSCDFQYRSLCHARNSKIEQIGIDTDYYLMKKETNCDVQYFMFADKSKFIPRKTEPDPELLFKIHCIFPIITIGLVAYYMTVVKKQRISGIKIPKRLFKMR